MAGSAPSIAALLDRAVALFPRTLAVTEGEVGLTYAEVGRRVAGLTAYLCERGLQPGDRVAVLGVNSAAYLISYFAAARGGFVLCPLNHRLAPRELTFVLQDAEARWLISDPAFADTLAVLDRESLPLEGVLWTAAAPDVSLTRPSHGWDTAADTDPAGSHPTPGRGDDVAHLYYTSGTTGTPKGVMLTHRNVCTHALGTIAELQLDAEDVWGHIAPMFHLADAWATFAITAVGGRHVMVPRFDAADALRIIARERITITNLIPTMLNLMVKHPEAARADLSSFRLLLSGGAPIAPTLVETLIQTFGVEYVQTYGMTETSPYLTLSLLTPELRRLPAAEQLRYRARTGRPFVTVELRVVDATGAPVPTDDATVGEIQVRGESVTPGYWHRPAETDAAFTKDGWLRTGDLAVVDATGYVDIVDRLKDMILSGGENIYSTEVEHIIYRHPAVLEAAVIGVPDERWGETVLAAVVLRDGATLDAESLIAHCREHLAAYKSPRHVRFLPALPRTGSGKIRKQGLRDRFGGADA